MQVRTAIHDQVFRDYKAKTYGRCPGFYNVQPLVQSAEVCGTVDLSQYQLYMILWKRSVEDTKVLCIDMKHDAG